jgi:hypothetical protein
MRYLVMAAASSCRGSRSALWQRTNACSRIRALDRGRLPRKALNRPCSLENPATRKSHLANGVAIAACFRRRRVEVTTASPDGDQQAASGRANRADSPGQMPGTREVRPRLITDRRLNWDATMNTFCPHSLTAMSRISFETALQS